MKVIVDLNPIDLGKLETIGRGGNSSHGYSQDFNFCLRRAVEEFIEKYEFHRIDNDENEWRKNVISIDFHNNLIKQLKAKFIIDLKNAKSGIGGRDTLVTSEKIIKLINKWSGL